MAVINKHLNQYWKCELPKQELDAFIRKFSDASILVSYQPFENGGPHGEQPRHPRQLSCQLFATLNSFPDGSSGMYGSGEGLQIPGIEYIRVQRTKSKGPYLQTNSFGFLSDPTESSIAKKMKKSYEAEHPVHLLAHIEFDLFAEGVEFAELIKSLRAQNQHQVFEKVWIFSSVTGSILYEENA